MTILRLLVHGWAWAEQAPCPAALIRWMGAMGRAIKSYPSTRLCDLAVDYV
ncbi:MAG TPA: hypothetical protein VGE00_09580 [Gammaproteobacteria bacterium]